jgi:hypothetical protein
MEFTKQALIDELNKIKPAEMSAADIKNGKIIEKMVEAIYDWIKTATVTVTVPDDITVQVDLNTGHGRTIDTIQATGTIQ